MIGLILVALAGAFFNMYRGGLLPKTKFFSGQYDIVNAVAFGVLAYLLLGTVVGAVVAGVMMLRGAADRWGTYFGAVIDKVITRPGVPYIDKLIARYKNNIVLWGVLGLSLRCAEWGLFLGAPFLSFYPMLVGLLAGPLLYISVRINYNYSWKIFEGLFGALLWASVYLSM